MTAPINLTVNGEPRRSAASTIAELVGELGLKPEKVAVERNGTIVPRSTLGEAALAEGDVLEIVHFVGGGGSPLPLREREEPRTCSGAEGEGSAAKPPLRGGPLSQPSPARGEG